MYIVYAILTLISAFFAWKLAYAFRHFVVKTNRTSAPTDDLPTVSICVPARNEKHAMTQSLEQAVASTYQKQEIIVVDDSSADNTSVLIKSFAHAGVRFVEGSELPDGWLGKNNALQSLLDEASGDYVLFMDVDTHIQPETVSNLVAYMKHEKVEMVSVLPRRDDGWRSSVLFGTLRYFWVLILHSKSRPAVASSAWMINRELLIEKLGGIKNYKSDIEPESSIATEFMQRDLYRFLIGTQYIGVSYEKKWSSQIDTSVRLMFPVLRQNAIRFTLAILCLLLLNMPILALLAGLIKGWTIIQVMAVWQICVFVAIYGLYLSKVWSKGWWLGALLWPIIIAQELVVVMLSIDRNLQHEVTWKGRPITSSYQRRVK